MQLSLFGETFIWLRICHEIHLLLKLFETVPSRKLRSIRSIKLIFPEISENNALLIPMVKLKVFKQLRTNCSLPFWYLENQLIFDLFNRVLVIFKQIIKRRVDWLLVHDPLDGIRRITFIELFQRQLNISINRVTQLRTGKVLFERKYTLTQLSNAIVKGSCLFYLWICTMRQNSHKCFRYQILGVNVAILSFGHFEPLQLLYNPLFK